MDLNIVRLVSSAFFDKLFYYIAPADAIVCQIAQQAFGKISYQQVIRRLATPKKRMLLLAWPFCNHNQENAPKAYKHAEFYAALRSNMTGSALQGGKTEFHRFLSRFESFMLQCVLNNVHSYADLNVLVLDFHDHDLIDYRHGVVAVKQQIYTQRNEWFACESRKSMTRDSGKVYVGYHDASSYHTLRMTSKLWGKVINAVVAQCFSTLRHFVYVDSFRLPTDFYINVNLDDMLTQMQQLETLYMPWVGAYHKAQFSVHRDCKCWRKLQNLPVEKRLPNLQRIVLKSPGCLQALSDDQFGVLSAFGNNIASESQQSQNLVVEVVGRPDHWPATSSWTKLNNCSVRYGKNFAHITPTWRLSQNNITLDNYDNPQFMNSAEKSLQTYADCRLRLQSMTGVVNASVAQIPACLTFDGLFDCDIDNAARFLTTLSSRLRWPLILTLKLDWHGLLTLRRLFTTLPSAKNNFHWTTCFPRGVLKLRLTFDEGWQDYTSNDIQRKIFQDIDKHLQSLHGKEERYEFPPHVTVELKPIPIKILYNKNDNMLAMRQYYEKCVQRFVADVTSDQPIFVPVEFAATGVQAAVNAMCRNLYATCQKLVVVFKFVYVFPINLDVGKANECLGKLEELMHDEQLEKEVLKLFAEFVAAEENENSSVPKFKSISIKHDVIGVKSDLRGPRAK